MSISDGVGRGIERCGSLSRPDDQQRINSSIIEPMPVIV
jgi:hypothetical protein